MSEEKKDHRNFYIDLTNINLDSPDGQSYLLTECEIALATKDLTASDIKAISKLNDLVKSHKDVDMIKILQRRLDDIEKKLEREVN